MIVRTALLLGVFLSSALGATGCISECADFASPAVSVTPLDSRTGEIVTGVSASVTDSAYSDALRPNGDGVLTGGHGRPGIYTVEIIAPGFEPWIRTGIRAADSDCGGVETVLIEARLVPTARGLRQRSPAHRPAYR